jgi:hypothetical protein
MDDGRGMPRKVDSIVSVMRMNRNFDLKPTDPLTGLHLRGTVTRRFLVNYAVPPEVLLPLVPPGGELSTWGGYGWVSACFVHVTDLRAAGMPAALGMSFNYLVQRTRARLPFPDGELREAVLMLEPSINRRAFSLAAGMTTGVRFRLRRIDWSETADCWRVVMREPAGEVLFDVEIPKASEGPKLPRGSMFPNAAEADRFLLGVSYGGQWQPVKRRLRLLTETHEPWQLLAADCRTRCNRFIEALCGHEVGADHVLTMTQVPHYFALAGCDVPLKLAGAAVAAGS